MPSDPIQLEHLCEFWPKYLRRKHLKVIGFIMLMVYGHELWPKYRTLILVPYKL